MMKDFIVVCHDKYRQNILEALAFKYTRAYKPKYFGLNFNWKN